jgi:iron complex outermembrane receptor protein
MNSNHVRGHIPAILLSTAMGPMFAAGAATADAQQPSTATADQLEEIIVTAEKREVNLQKEPEAVSVVSAEALDDEHLVKMTDLTGQVPGLVVSPNEGYRTVVAIRGLGLQANQNDIADPSVSLHIDGVYIPNDVSMNSDFIDVDRIEVLRGPQGTVFGQNSIGGAISITSKRPNLQNFEAQGDITGGSYGTVQARAMVNVPIGSTLAVRVAVDEDKHDGYATNVLLGDHPDQANNLSVHGQILWQPVDDFSAILRIYHFGTGHLTGQEEKNIDDSTPGAYNIAQGYPTKFYYNSNVYSATLEYDTHGIAFKSISSYQHDSNIDQQDNGKTALNIDIVPNENLATQAVTQEFNITSIDKNSIFDWILGGFYLNLDKSVDFVEFVSHDKGATPINLAVNTANPYSNPDFSFATATTPKRESISGFAQGTLHMTDAFRLTAGARFTKDIVTSDVCNNFVVGSACTPLEQTSTQTTGKVGLEYDVAPANLLYGTVTRGAKPGGTNLSFGTPPLGLVTPTYGGETILAYEVGSKNRFLDNKLQINGSAFYYDYKNLQFQNSDPGPFSGGVSNIPTSTVDGAELEFSVLPTQGLRFDGNIAYLHSEITSHELVLDSVAATNITNLLEAEGYGLFSPQVAQGRANAEASPYGNPLPDSPEFVFNLSASYAWPIGGAGVLTSRADYSHRDSFNYRVFNNFATDVVPSVDQVNLFFGWQPSQAKWNADLIVSNVANKAIISSRYTDAFGIGATSDQYLPPRLVLVRIGYKF